MSEDIGRLAGIVARLRAPGGCPWDREQTAATLIPSLLEEAHEVADAIERGDSGDLRDELGDLLINILMQAEIASEQKVFTLDAVASAASEKLVRRHPHVFGDTTASTSEAVLVQWEEIKRAERAAKGSGESAGDSLLDGVPRSFPALVKAQKIQKKAAKAGFDWERPGDVIDKIREEIAEVEHELHASARQDSAERLRDEVGDLLFAVVNLSRALSIDAESALRAATGKFERRFRAMERAVPDGIGFGELSPGEMNALWEQAKQTERSA